jgi:peptidoglycan/LPS O-acetylase OafA/YrhL
LQDFRRIPADVSVFLDLFRILATAMVVFHHLSQESDIFSIPFIDRLGQEGVIIFFLLSGFVIFASEANRSDSTGRYTLRRTLRIYPVLIVAMIISAAAALIDGTFYDRFSISEALGNLLAFQDIAGLKPGVSVSPFLGNSPLWSLSYEIVFYVLFPTVFAAWKFMPRLTSHCVGLICCIAYIYYIFIPNHFGLVLSYFLLWWVGACAAAFFLGETREKSTIMIPVGWLVGMVLISTTAFLKYDYTGLGVFPMLMFRHFSVALAILVVAFIVPFRVFAAQLVPISRPITFASSVTYGIYAFHYPIMIKSGATNSYHMTFIAFTFTVFLAWVIDRKLCGYLKKNILGKN